MKSANPITTIGFMFSLTALTALTGCATNSADDTDWAQNAVIYGADDRTEVYASSSATFRNIATSAIAVHMNQNAIDESDPSQIRITYSRTLGQAQDLCDGERYTDQIEPGTCSGTLIDPQHLLTAAHCVDDGVDCNGSRVWLFGFRHTAAGTLATHTSDDVYRCDAVTAFRDDDDVDFAVVRLDRPVVGHTPVAVRPLPAGLALGTALTLIGHPNGLPMKIAEGGVVTRSDSDGLWLIATVDSFHGNSGSGVFDDSGNLVALLDGGMDDYVARGDCNVVNVVDPPPEDGGETLTYLRPALDAFCETPGVTSSLCDCEGPCVVTEPGDTCATASPIEPVTQSLDGTTTGYTASRQGSCGGAGPERAWTFTLAAESRIQARSAGFDTLLYLEAGCGGEELACHDDIDRETDRGSRIDLVAPPGTYVLTLDSYGRDAESFTLSLEITPTGAPTPDAGIRDAGAPDGGAAHDSGISQDAALMLDGAASGEDAGPPIEDGGGCVVSPGSTRAPLAWLMAILFVVAFRRRHSIPRSHR